MATIQPFRGLRAADHLAADVIAPPYDVMNVEEARAIVRAHPKSFLRVTRPEADLPDVRNLRGTRVYDHAKQTLAEFLDQGWLVRDASPGYYLYRLTWRGMTQRGLVCAASVEEYDRGVIKRHELTRPVKEQDRVDHIEATGTQTGMVFLAYHDSNRAVRSAIAKAAELEPVWTVTTDDEVEHALTPIADTELVAELTGAFGGVEALYVADGHHRSAAASRVLAEHRGTEREDEASFFLAGLFPDSELHVMAYNRVVKDLHGMSPAAFVTGLEQWFTVTDTDLRVPRDRGTFTMFLDDQWKLLTPKSGAVNHDDPVLSLDVAVLQTRVLYPLLGIEDPRTDERIRFVGGIRGPEALEEAVLSGEAKVAFHLFPTGLDQLFAVADAGKLMPPKSTWFEPKLRAGVVAHQLW